MHILLPRCLKHDVPRKNRIDIARDDDGAHCVSCKVKECLYALDQLGMLGFSRARPGWTHAVPVLGKVGSTCIGFGIRIQGLAQWCSGVERLKRPCHSLVSGYAGNKYHGLELLASTHQVGPCMRCALDTLCQGAHELFVLI